MDDISPIRIEPPAPSTDPVERPGKRSGNRPPQDGGSDKRPSPKDKSAPDSDEADSEASESDAEDEAPLDIEDIHQVDELA